MLEISENMLDKGEYICAMFIKVLRHNTPWFTDYQVKGVCFFTGCSLWDMTNCLTKRRKRVRVNSNFSTWENIIARVLQGYCPLLFNIFIDVLFLFISNSYSSNYTDDNTVYYAFGYNLEEIKNTLRWENIIARVLQGSILQPLLFNIFIDVLFLFISNSYSSNYTDDNTVYYAFGYNLEEIKNTLRFDFDLVSKWFEENYMVLNANKCHFMCLSKDPENETFIFNNFIFNNFNKERILGITIDNKLTFKSHTKL